MHAITSFKPPKLLLINIRNMLSTVSAELFSKAKFKVCVVYALFELDDVRHAALTFPESLEPLPLTEKEVRGLRLCTLHRRMAYNIIHNHDMNITTKILATTSHFIHTMLQLSVAFYLDD